MTSAAAGPRPVAGRLPGLLLAAAHPLPTAAVTALTALLTVALDLPVDRALLVVAAVLTGQLSIGWSNDLLDASRDRAVGRSDKPLATGALPLPVVRTACAAAVVLTVPLGLASGLAAGVVNLVCAGAGWAYNLGLKATTLSFLPYAVCFGGLPVLVALADRPSTLPAWWLPVAGALLGVGAHLLNVLPDLADDAATGVRGLPHRLGARWCPPVAVGVLALASLVTVLGSGLGVATGIVALVLVAALAAVALAGRGRTPFLAAVGIATVDVVLLVLAS